MRDIEGRKADHIEVCLEGSVCSDHNYWDDVIFVHNALPEVDLEEIDTSITFMGRRLAFPLIITAITGGYPKAKKINENIARACEGLQIGMGVGSQRAAIEGKDASSYSVIKEYDVPLVIGNIGAPQLIEQGDRGAISVSAVGEAMQMVDADLMAVHLNFLQEVVQPGGDTRAEGCLEAIRGLCRDFPIMVKETGAGLSREVALRLKGAGVSCLDVSGVSGTSFSAVERYRAESVGDQRGVRLGDTFREWGIPAPVSVIWADVGLPLVASGGIRHGLDVAKGLAMGASCAGTARSILHAAVESYEAVVERLQLMIDETRAAMFLTGSRRVADLQKTEVIIGGSLLNWVSWHKE